MEVTKVATPLELDELKALLSKVYKEKFGEPIGDVEPYLLAMLSIENAQGNKSFNHNWGFITTTGVNTDYFTFIDNPRKFPAFKSHEEGLLGFLDLLSKKGHRNILAAAKADDFQAFFTALTTTYCQDCNTPDLIDSYTYFINKYKGKKAVKRSSKRSVGDQAALLVIAATVVGGIIFAIKRTRK